MMRSLSLRLILTTAALLLVSHPESRAQNLVFDSSDFASWDHPVGLVNVLSDRVEVKRFGKTFNAVTNADRLSSSIIGGPCAPRPISFWPVGWPTRRTAPGGNPIPTTPCSSGGWKSIWGEPS